MRPFSVSLIIYLFMLAWAALEREATRWNVTRVHFGGPFRILLISITEVYLSKRSLSNLLLITPVYINFQFELCWGITYHERYTS